MRSLRKIRSSRLMLLLSLIATILLTFAPVAQAAYTYNQAASMFDTQFWRMFDEVGVLPRPDIFAGYTHTFVWTDISGTAQGKYEYAPNRYTLDNVIITTADQMEYVSIHEIGHAYYIWEFADGSEYSANQFAYCHATNDAVRNMALNASTGHAYTMSAAMCAARDTNIYNTQASWYSHAYDDGQPGTPGAQ